MTDFLKGEDYPWLCPTCQKMTNDIAQLFHEGLMPDTDDIEAPAMHMYDNKLYCGGTACDNKGQ